MNWLITFLYTSNANRAASVDLLGSDYFWSIVQWRQQQLPSGLFLISSSLGILISGRHHSERPSQDVSAMPCQTDQLDDNVATMWKLDTIGITDNPTFSDDDMALQTFNNTVKFDINNARYSVTLPWKAPDEVLPSNYGLAMGRLKSLSRRFGSSPELKEQYDEIIQHQLDVGIIEEAPLQANNRVHYLPHHPVVTPLKTTTKIRVVYDGSAKSNKSDLSLNE